jgi:hypothetical protein
VPEEGGSGFYAVSGRLKDGRCCLLDRYRAEAVCYVKAARIRELCDIHFRTSQSEYERLHWCRRKSIFRRKEMGLFEFFKGGSSKKQRTISESKALKKSAALLAQSGEPTTLIDTSIERIGVNITNATVKKFMNDYCDKLMAKGFRFIDDRSETSGNLYVEFNKFDTTIKPGEIYVYSKPHFKLVISRGDDLGVMVSFTDQK